MHTATRRRGLQAILAVTIMVSSLSLLGGGVASASPDTSAITPPSGSNRQFAQVFAEGQQVYRCQMNDQAIWEWTFVEPRATLFASWQAVGRHYAGPTWEWSDGSKVAGAKVASMASPTGSIPWLLLKTKSYSAAAGNFLARTTYIQRTQTVGGQAPGMLCDEITAWTVQPVYYNAVYTFYQAYEY